MLRGERGGERGQRRTGEVERAQGGQLEDRVRDVHSVQLVARDQLLRAPVP